MKYTYVGFCFILAGYPTMSWGQDRTADAANVESTEILFVFDASNSMNAFWDGNRKIEVATRLLTESLEELYGIPGLELGLRVYGHQTKFIEGQQDCDDTELVISFSKGNNLLIRKALSRIQARGTTPIARSLQRAAKDFSDINSRKVIILITDGIEACDEDPCVVSKLLQEQGIIVKPFIIGIGIDEAFKETFRCVGNFFDAADTDTFREVLDLVIEQAINDTSFEVDLIDGGGEASITDVAITLLDAHDASTKMQWMHTLNQFGKPDTIPVDPIPAYDVIVHTVPQLRRNDVRLQPRMHNYVRFENAGQGVLRAEFARGLRNGYGQLPITIFTAGSSLPLLVTSLNQEVHLLEGAYDVYFPTHPPILISDVSIQEGSLYPVSIPQPGVLQLNGFLMGFATVLNADHEVVYQWKSGKSTPVGQHLLQPGDYTFVYRARSAQSIEFSFVKSFNIRSGNTTHLSING
jgi:Ca-activated chloride channel family protein